MSVLSDHSKGLIMTLVAVLLLSPDALLVRLIGTDPWTLLFWRGLLSGGILIIFLGALYRRQFIAMCKAPGRAGPLSALVAAVGNVLFVCSLRQTAAANTMIILAATPLITALCSHLFLKEKTDRKTWFAIATGCGGILIIFSGSLDGSHLFGDLLAFCAACCWAGNLVIVRSARPLNMIPANAFGSLLVVPIAFLVGAEPLAVSGADALFLALLGLLVLPVSFALITLGPRYLPAPEVSLILLLETLLSPFWVWLVIGEEPGRATLLGGLLILGTILAHTMTGIHEQRKRSV